MKDVANWRRPLKSGYVQYFFKVDGLYQYGSAPSTLEALALQRKFEREVGRKLPPAEWKNPLFKVAA